MVPTLVSILLFASYGAWQAKKTGGKTLDILHYAGTYAIIGLIVGTLLAIVLSRMV